jgi:hypothetical protein
LHSIHDSLLYNKVKGTFFFKRDYFCICSDWWIIGLTPYNLKSNLPSTDMNQILNYNEEMSIILAIKSLFFKYHHTALLIKKAGEQIEATVPSLCSQTCMWAPHPFLPSSDLEPIFSNHYCILLTYFVNNSGFIMKYLPKVVPLV